MPRDRQAKNISTLNRDNKISTAVDEEFFIAYANKLLSNNKLDGSVFNKLSNSRLNRRYYAHSYKSNFSFDDINSDKFDKFGTDIGNFHTNDDSEYLDPIIYSPNRLHSGVYKKPIKKKQKHVAKEQLRYDRNIKRHIQIRFMLSLRLVEDIKRKNRSKEKNKQQIVAKKGFNGPLVGSSNRGKLLFDMEEAKHEIFSRCHGDWSPPAGGKGIELENERSPGGGMGRARNGALALHYAAARGCLDCVRLLVDSAPHISADTQMDNDVTPVYLAAQEGHLQVLRFLVEEAGGSLVARARDGMTPLHAASQMGCLDCLQWMILERGVDPNLRDGDGATPLHFAASRGHLPTVRWLLASGAVITQDRFGKSPINDAAENHQVECLNALVQHGAAMEGREGRDGRDGRDGRENREIATHKSLSGYKGVHSCTCREGDNMCSQADCINSNRRRSHSVSRASEPFYLHPPVGANGGHATGPAHAPSDGLYVNPMRNTTHATASSGEESSAASTSSSTGGESFYLHNPQELIYNRVKDLFEGKASPVPLRSITDEREKIRKHSDGMTVKAEVHSSSSGAGSDGNLSSSDGSDVRDHRDIRDLREHDYEDICPPGRAEDARSIYIRSAKRAAENEAALRESRKEKNADDNSKNNKRIVNDASAESGVSSASDGGSSCEEGGGGRSGGGGPPPPPPPPALPIHLALHPAFHIAEERNNSEGIQRPASRASTPGDRLVNKQLVLPFIPPSFPHLGDSDRLIKPSEYLRSIGDRRSSAASSKHSSDVEDNYMVVSQSDRGRSEGPPIDTAPPPPPPPPPQPADTKLQPLSTISIRDLNSVRLRRTDKMLASKTLSAPVRSVSMQCLATEPFQAQKTDLIAELKMSKDITGIKKMKVERAKMENMVDKEVYSEFTKQFTANNFVEKIPERDQTGNVIPAWKRQMLAKKAAERARRELEQRLAREAEHRRLQAIPAWKRQLLAKKEESDTKMKSTIYTPRVVDEPRNGFHQHEVDACWRNRSPFPPFSPHQRAVSIDNIDLAVDREDRLQNGDKENRETKINGEAETNGNGNGNGESHSEGKTHESDEEIQIIPWRAQLRKTNSKLNLLD